jgi:HD-like signal output (HDOD) protein
MDPFILVLSAFASGLLHMAALLLLLTLLREKELLLATLAFLEEHESQAVSGDIPFQLEIKVGEVCRTKTDLIST